MTLVLTASLYTSIVALLGIILVKRFEIKRNKALFSSIRPYVGGFFDRTLHFFEHTVPILAVMYTKAAVRFIRVALHFVAARTIVAAEAYLERILSALRYHTEVSVATKTSAFLREVSEHKKLIRHRSRKMIG